MKNLISKEEKDQIDEICAEFEIKGYSINTDGSINVQGSVNLTNLGLHELPLKFSKVSGDFKCDCNALKSLEGVPHTVGGNFDCESNMLRSLEGCPTTIGGYLNCSYNYLTTTYSGDKDIELGGRMGFKGNHLPQLLLDNLEHIRMILKFQRLFMIWDEDLSFNQENFKDLILEIEEGLE